MRWPGLRGKNVRAKKGEALKNVCAKKGEALKKMLLKWLIRARQGKKTTTGDKDTQATKKKVMS